MRITLIGAGNLATNIGKAMLKAGHDIVQVYSRNLDNARSLAQTLGAVPTNDSDSLTADADLYLLSVKDSALADIASRICKDKADKVFAHTAGSVGMDIFRSLASHYGVVYPMQTFSKAREVDFGKIPVFIEYSDETAKTRISALANTLSQKVVELSSDHRKYLHLAAVFSCNFVNHCYHMAADIMEAHGLTFDMLLPLIDETALKVHHLHPKDAQTGPAIRYDENVINKQLHLLDHNPLMRDIYEKMSMGIHLNTNEKKQ